MCSLLINEKGNLCKLSKQFARYLKANYNIKYVKDITSEHAQAYLDSLKTSCTQATLNTYKSYLNKIAHLCSNRFKLNLTFNEVVTPFSEKTTAKGELIEAYRTKSMSLDDYNKLEKYMLKQTEKYGGSSVYALMLSRYFSCRNFESVSLTLNSIDLDKMQLTIIGKGKRSRIIPIESVDQKQLINNLIKHASDDGRLINIKASSVSTTIRRAMKKIEVNDRNSNGKLTKISLSDKHPLSTQHAVRKLFSKQMYLHKLKNDSDYNTNPERAKKKAAKYVVGLLGHGNRTELQHIYIFCD